MLKRIFVILSLILLGSIAAYIVYLEDMRYSLPTPVPTNYEMIPLGTFISPPSPILTVRDKPLFIHFFNQISHQNSHSKTTNCATNKLRKQ